MLTLFHKAQLFDIFHSTWFMILIGLLSINLVVCSLNRLPVSWRRFRGSSDSDDADVFKDLPADPVIASERPVPDEAVRAESMLKKGYKRVRHRDTEKGVVLAGEKGNASHMGVYVIHFSVLAILAGMMIGYFFGFDAYVSVAEGESADTVQLKGGKRTRSRWTTRERSTWKNPATEVIPKTRGRPPMLAAVKEAWR